MSIWKARNEAVRVQESARLSLDEMRQNLAGGIAAAMQAGEIEKAAGDCIWPTCNHAAAHGEYCPYHYDLLVGSGIIKDKDQTSRIDEILKAARREVTARYPNNPDYRGWNDDEDDDGR